jgi:hypothetical protein
MVYKIIVVLYSVECWSGGTKFEALTHYSLLTGTPDGANAISLNESLQFSAADQL